MDNRWIQWLKQVSDIIRPYILRKGDGLRYAANLAIFYISLQGIRLVSSWANFELSFPGVDTVPGAIVVCFVCLALILAHCYIARFMPTQSEFFREVLRLRELGFTLHEIEEKQVAYRFGLQISMRVLNNTRCQFLCTNGLTENCEP